MFQELVNTLTPTDRKELAALGVPSSRISEWKSLNRFPTRAQAAAISIVKGIPLPELESELSMLEIQADKRHETLLAKIKKL
ncbi:hypothetical protein D3C71_1844500 [compost metagenome]